MIYLVIVLSIIGLTLSYFFFKIKDFFSEERIVKIVTFVLLSKIRLSTIKSVIYQLGWLKTIQFCLCFVRDKIYILCGGKSNSVIIKDGHYILTYCYGIRTYNIKWKARLGPNRIIEILDEENNDVTQMIRSYLGPGEQFHGIHLSPKDLGFEQLTFHNIYGETKCFRDKQIMILV